MARFRAVVIHAPGFGGRPVTGQRSRATAKASWTRGRHGPAVLAPEVVFDLVGMKGHRGVLPLRFLFGTAGPRPGIKRLFTYPDEFELVGSRQSAQTQLGNSVPPLLAEKAFRALHGEA